MGTAWNIKCFILKIKGKQTINANHIWLSLEVIATLIREMLLQKLENYRWLIIDWFTWLIALLSLSLFESILFNFEPTTPNYHCFFRGPMRKWPVCCALCRPFSILNTSSSNARSRTELPVFVLFYFLFS